MPRTLLLADDSVVIQKLVGLSFANEDIELITADNGDDAIERARETKPDLVLADVIMPGKSGYEVCEAVKQDAALEGTPVLLLTGTFEAFDEDRANSAGADGHITKPFEAQALVDRVKQMMAGNASAPPAAAETAAPAPAQAPRPSEDSYDFFDDDASEIPAGGVARDAVIETSPLDESDEFDETPALDPLDDLAAGSLGSDHTVALMPEEDALMPAEDATGSHSVDPVRDLPTDLVELPPSEPELEVRALDDDATHVGGGETLVPPISDPAATVLADDFASDVGLSNASAEPADVAPEFADPAATVLADDFLAGPAEALAETEPEAPHAELEPARLPDAERPYGAGIDEAAPRAEEVVPAEPVESSAEPELSSSDEDFDFGSEPEPIDPGNTVLADDLFAEEPAPEAVAGEPLDADPLGAVPELDIEFGADSQPEANVQLDPAADSAFDVSASDLGDLGDLSAPAPDAATGSGIDEVTADAEVPAAAFSQPSATAGEATPASSPPPGLDPVLRDRVHETLEKIAWEAFSELSEAVVREVMQRVERIAWEVIPQMSETLVREEIERMKDGDDS